MNRAEILSETMWFPHRNRVLSFLPMHGHVCEIGVHKGLFSQEILNHNHPKKLHLIDCWEKQDAGIYDDSDHNVAQAVQEDLYQQVADKFDQQLRSEEVVLHRQYSTEALPNFEDDYFDWGYIDGNHSYEACKEDLNLLYPKVKSGGYLVGHDYLEEKYEPRIGVVQAVHEFIDENDDISFVGITQEKHATFILKKH